MLRLSSHGASLLQCAGARAESGGVRPGRRAGGGECAAARVAGDPRGWRGAAERRRPRTQLHGDGA
eukprot:8264474-Pyramimonas_sp.AAC.1